METHQRYLISNSQSGSFESTYQLFLNYKYGLNSFDINIEKSEQYFILLTKLLHENFYLESLSIKNYKKLSKIKLNLDKSLNVLVGKNGVGKTSILQAIRKNIMWIAASTLRDNTSGGKIDSDDEINNEARLKKEGVSIDCHFIFGNQNKISGRIARTVDISIESLKSELKDYRDFGLMLRTLNSHKDINLPLFAFYGIDRLLQSSLVKTDLSFSKTEGYDEALKKRTNFSIYIEWLIQLLKISKPNKQNLEQEKAKQQLQILQDLGASDKQHPLHEMLINLQMQLDSININFNTLKAKKWLKLIESIHSEIYPNFIELKLINDDDGKDKVALICSNEIFFLHQLSDGQRVMLGLVGDIARRLILLNDTRDNPLDGQGIVLIDEIELHLHPTWQQEILLLLRRYFSNIQFIITTHSPHVLSTIDNNSIKIIYENGTVESPPIQTKGVASSDALEQIMETYSMPKQIKEVHLIDDFLEFVSKNCYESDEAKNLFLHLKNHYGSEHPIIKKLEAQVRVADLKNNLIKKK